MLGLLNFPSKIPKRVAHPASYEEVDQNIESQYVFKTNGQGLVYRDVPLEKPANTYRMFVSGDSLTEGIGVDESERITSLLEDDLASSAADALFINGGLGGTGPLQYGRLFLEVGLKYNIDALLICVFVNDVANTSEEVLQNPFAANYSRSIIKRAVYYILPHIYTRLAEIQSQMKHTRETKTRDFISTISRKARERDIPQSQIIRWKESLPPELVKAVNRGLYNGSILSYGLLYPDYWSDSIDISSDRAKRKWETMAETLSEILVRAKQNGIETAVVLLPTQFHYDRSSHSEKNRWTIAGSVIKEEWLSEDTEIQKKMRLWASLEAVPFLDLTPIFRKAIEQDKNLYYPLDGHWNYLGHKVAANAIASWLYNQQVFSFIKEKTLASQ
jgi:lysophospholipase L1-like esterase